MNESGQPDPSVPVPSQPGDLSEKRTSLPAEGTIYARPAAGATLPPRPVPPTAPELPPQFGRYRIVRCLGQGAMGAVYLADDTQLDRPVALKIPKFGRSDDAELIERFYREARSAATLRHANLCPVYDAGEIGGIQYLSMAYLEGERLSQRLERQGALAPRAAAECALKLARALAVAHARGVIHRDLKPDNIMIDSHSEPIVMDFGLARRMNGKDSRLTQDGLLMGSPAYMSPEQIEGDAEKIGPRCDIYSLGVLLYEMLTGEVPFRGSIAAVMGQIVTSEPKPPSALRPEIDAELEGICLKMMARRPEDRFSSMDEVAIAIENELQQQADRKGSPQSPARRFAPTVAAMRPRHKRDRGLVIAPWMFWMGLAIVVAGFGVTWQLFVILMKQQGSLETIRVDPTIRQAIDQGEAKVSFNTKTISAERLSRPLPLQAGENTLDVRQGDTTRSYTISVSPQDEPSFLVQTAQGWQRKWLPRLVAEWALSVSGEIRLVGRDTPVTTVESLPAEPFQIAELDLTRSGPITESNLELIERLKSLKVLQLSKSSLSEKALSRLRAALPNCGIEIGPSETRPVQRQSS